jgi:type II restriction/modification system DNA methylase subunit YeeA
MKKIKEIKIQNFKAYTSQLEKQLDEMVYKLYELTEEEINVIENKK